MPSSESKALVQIRFRTIALCTVCLPLFSFIFCVIWSLIFNFRQVTSTHCQVSNYLPSISAAIGGYTPQRYVWRIGIGLHAAPRYIVMFMYYSYYSNLILNEVIWQRLVTLACILNGIEITCLIGLTYVSSSENYPAHEKFFVTFMLSSLTYMLLLCLLPRIASKVKIAPMEAKSLNVKTYLGMVNVIFFLMALYFFFRHNWYCEGGVYTLFAICEYIVVVSNMGFHMTAYWDFSNQFLIITPEEGISIHKKFDSKPPWISV
ncbi:post-GPI attachment to proteins factor 2 [Centruroides vittatus]|uniref:post-GPI attachment to proteins factor 2 n=1 Tax=Centruroides vittatus TaxID=120091 RepID=UPI00350F6902